MASNTVTRGTTELCDFPNSFYFWDEDDGIVNGYITATFHLLLTTDKHCSERACDITIAAKANLILIAPNSVAVQIDLLFENLKIFYRQPSYPNQTHNSVST